MNTVTTHENIRDLYAKGLEDFLTEEDEKYLTQAYVSGHKSLQVGLSEFDIIELHHKSLSAIPMDVIPERDKRNQLASTYLKEWLSPYVVKLQSFRDVINELNTKNEQLTKEIESRKKVQAELRENKDYFQSLIEYGQDIITVIGYDGTVKYNSPSIERVLKYEQNELLGRSFFRYIHKEDLEDVKELIRNIRDKPKEVKPFEFRFLSKNGQWVYFESTANKVHNRRDDSIIFNSRDVTDRKFTMRKLREHRAKLAEAQHIAKVGSWEWQLRADPELEWSEEMCRIYGLTPGSFDQTYETFLNHVHPEDRSYVERRIKKALKYKNPFSFEFRIIRTDGSIRNLYGKGRVIEKDGEILKMIGTGQDITEQKKKERKLKKYSEQLRKLSEKIERTREEERIRIAREIHDELGQMLTVLKMDISMLSGQMKKRVSENILKFFNGEAEKILERINTIINSVQRITTDLRPEVLDDLGLIEALQWQAKEIEQRTKLDIRFKSELEHIEFLNDDESTTIFRVFQETLNNIVKHAQASKVEIELERKNNHLLLSVHDDGIGITEQQKENSSSFGIIGMRERTRFLGGDVYIEGEERKGTKVTLHIPLDTENGKFIT